MKPARLLVAKFPVGHVMGEATIPLMIIRYGDDHHFETNTGLVLDKRGNILNKEEFLARLKKYKPGIVQAIRDIPGEVMLQVWPERVCVYLGRALDS